MWKLVSRERDRTGGVVMVSPDFDFDTIVDRRNTSCGKWDTMDQKYGNKRLIHLGVADMDFRAPQPIIDGFQQCIDHGIFGYTDLNEAFYDSFIAWEKRKHDTCVRKEEILFCPRINISSSLCVETFTQPGDSVIIHTPAYGPLYSAIVKNNRQALESRLVLENDRYRIDLEHLEEVITPNTKLFILCSPHNPVGRVWTKKELTEIGEFCVRHDLILFSDEIHGDITAPGVRFTSTLSLNEEIRQRLVVAAERAYTQCDDWYDAALAYINENEVFTRRYFAEHMSEFHIYPREGTYLLWIDYSQLGCTEEELEQLFLEKAQVSVYTGTVFREEGRGCIRVNIASPRKLLEQAYGQMAGVYDALKMKLK